MKTINYIKKRMKTIQVYVSSFMYEVTFKTTQDIGLLIQYIIQQTLSLN